MKRSELERIEMGRQEEGHTGEGDEKAGGSKKQRRVSEASGGAVLSPTSLAPMEDSPIFSIPSSEVCDG